MAPKKRRKDLELDPDAYDDTDRDRDEVTPVKGTPPKVDKQDEVDQ